MGMLHYIEQGYGALTLAYSQDVFGCTTGGLIVWDAGSSWINHYLLKLEDEKLIIADSLSENYRGDDPSAEDTNESFDYESEEITFYAREDLSILNSLLYGENSSDSTSNDGSDLVIYEDVSEENDSETEIVIVIQ